MKMEMCDCENMILREIAIKSQHQRDIAKTYRLCMESSEVDKIDWLKVNIAIIERWSPSGLRRIKELAWSGKCFGVKK